MPHRYTDDEKRRVLERLIANRGDVARTAAEYGINERTIYVWRKDSKFADLLIPNLQNLTNLPNQDSSSPSLYTERGPGGEVLPTETAQAFQTLHDKLLTIIHTLSNRIEEAIDEAPLNQRVTALSQLIDRIAKLAAMLPTEEQEIEYVHEYEYEVEHHVEKEETGEEDHRAAPEDQAED